MATRTPARPAAKKAAANRAASRKPAAKKPAARKPAARKAPARSGPGPLQLTGKAFKLAATGVGTVTRAAGQGARDLDPAHRRDGLGLLCLVGALLSAAGAWWHAGTAGNALADVVEGGFGKGAMVLPLVLLVAGVVVLRHPSSPGGRGRLLVGWTTLLLGALGVLHVAGSGPRRGRGGVLGFLLGDPLERMLSRTSRCRCCCSSPPSGCWSRRPPPCTRCRSG